MKKQKLLFEKDEHRWFVIYDDSNQKNLWVDTNEYVVHYNGKTLITDPGGTEIFPFVAPTVSSVVDINSLEFLFASHQDPDIASSLPLWIKLNPSIKCCIHWLWKPFVANFGGEDENFITFPDRGGEINLNGLPLEVVPAHYLHSPGNIHLYDPTSKIYFSGDIGSAMIPENNRYLFVEDFNEHTEYMEEFHRRWFGSNEHKNDWCERVSNMDIELLCPQHGAIFKGENVKRFIDWFYKLKVGDTNMH